jgi:hypothetical protein
MPCSFDRGFIVFQSFGQHGRELITSEVALSLLYILTEKRRIAGVDLSSFEKILENLVIKVSPSATYFISSALEHLQQAMYIAFALKKMLV